MRDINSLNMEEYAVSLNSNKEELKKYAELLNVPLDKIGKAGHHIVYHEEGRFYLTFQLHALDIPSQPLKNQGKETVEYANYLYDKGAWDELYETVIDKLGCILSMGYIMNNESIPESERVALWLETYMYAEYNHDLLINQINLNMFKKYKKEDKPTQNGLIKVYRGQTLESTPYAKAISWTTDLKTAQFFMTRYNSDGASLIEGYIKPEDVYAYIDEREHEVLLDQTKLLNVTVLQQESIPTLVERYRNSMIKDTLIAYPAVFNLLDLYLTEDLFENPTSIHGYSHSRRVLQYVLVLALLEEELTEEEVFLLASCAVYHDIGRTHDNTCEYHGKWSIEKVEELGYDKLCNFVQMEKYERYFDFIVETHCKGDQTARKILDERSMKGVLEDAERCWYLYGLFCDADALDRHRINDLDMTYLRNLNAKKMVYFTYRFTRQKG